MTRSRPPRRDTGRTDDEQPRVPLLGLVLDDRAQSVVLGAILVFGILVLALGIYQAFAVPAQNQEVEFKHNLQLQQSMQELSNGIESTALRGDGGSVTMRLGTNYPTRMLAINPPPPGGELRTETPSQQIQVEHATSLDDEVADYWTGGTAVNFPTKYVEYSPGYHVYSGAPTTVYENSLVYNQFRTDTTLTVSDQNLVEGRTITLVALDGELSRSTNDAVSVNVQKASGPAREVALRNTTGEKLTVTLPTQLSEEQWNQTLADEIDEDGTDPDRYLRNVQVDDAAGTLTLTFEQGASYNMRLAKVGVGQGVSEESAHYITLVEGGGGNLQQDSSRTVTFEVRDQYNNPVSGAQVGVSIRDEGTADEGNVSAQGKTGKELNNLITDEDGQITLEYTPADVTEDLPIEIRASFSGTPTRNPSFDGSTMDNALAKFTVTDTDAPNQQFVPGLDASGYLVFEGASVNEISVSGMDATSSNVSYRFKNVRSENLTLIGIRLNYITSFDTAGGVGSSADDINDGPNNITRILMDGNERVIHAEETSRPHFFWDQTPAQGNITITSGSEVELFMDFDESFPWRSNDGIALDVTLYFESGLTGSYPIHKFRP